MVMAEEKTNREGKNLLGSPTFKELENGKFKCLETGHELPAKEIESYGQSKRCRLGLIDAALFQKKPPINLFKQNPLSSSKLICKLTGDSINKSEEHIWKHINGKRFLNKLEQMETEKDEKNKIKKKKEVSEIISEIRDPFDKGSDEEDGDFSIPFDDGKFRWSDSDDEDGVDEERDTASAELAARTKRMSIEIGPSSFASRKKKSKIDSGS